MTERALPFPKIGDQVTVTKSSFTRLGSPTPVVRIILDRGVTPHWKSVDPSEKCGYIVFVSASPNSIPDEGEFTIEITKVTHTCGFAKLST